MNALLTLEIQLISKLFVDKSFGQGNLNADGIMRHYMRTI